MKGFLSYCRICNSRDLQIKEIPLDNTQKYLYWKYCKNCECEITIRRFRREDQ